MSDNQPIERIERYIAEYEDAPNWGGPTMYPAPPKIADLKALVALTKQTEPLGLERLTEILSERRLPGTRNGPITEPRDLAEHILASLKGNQHVG